MTRQRVHYSSTSLTGKTALVTGGSKGIGEATVRRLAEAGAEVAVVARTGAALDKLVTELTRIGHPVLGIPADVGQQDQLDGVLRTLRDTFGRLDILINNAGTAPASRRAENMPLTDWQHTLDVNLTAPWYLASRARDLMSRGSVVVNISSTAAYRPSIGMAPYNVSKAGLTMLTRALALEWASAGIRVVGVAPGKVATELSRAAISYAEAKRQKYNPQNRIADVTEIAELIFFLVTDEARFITGSTHVTDGGELLGTMSL